VREDDPTIAGVTLLYRRVPPQWVVPDRSRNCTRLASAAFQGDEMSVDVGDTLEAIGETPESVVRDYPGFYLVAFPARVARDAEQAVCRDALPDDEAHGLVVGKKTGARQKQIGRGSQWVVPPEHACEPPMS
jgi:hypothetical protein